MNKKKDKIFLAFIPGKWDSKNSPINQPSKPRKKNERNQT